MSLILLDFKVHGTSPQFRAGLLYIIDFAIDYMVSVEHSNKDGLLKKISSCVSKLEVEFNDSDEFRKGLYSGFGWYRHALHEITEFDIGITSKLKEASESLRRVINVLGT